MDCKLVAGNGKVNQYQNCLALFAVYEVEVDLLDRPLLENQQVLAVQTGL